MKILWTYHFSCEFSYLFFLSYYYCLSNSLNWANSKPQNKNDKTLGKINIIISNPFSFFILFFMGATLFHVKWILTLIFIFIFVYQRWNGIRDFLWYYGNLLLLFELRKHFYSYLPTLQLPRIFPIFSQMFSLSVLQLYHVYANNP